MEEGFTFKQPPLSKKVTFSPTKRKGKKGEKELDLQKSTIGKTLSRRLSISPSLHGISVKSAKTTRNQRLVDPTIVDNDLELPTLTETRVRPAPEFVV